MIHITKCSEARNKRILAFFLQKFSIWLNLRVKMEEVPETKKPQAETTRRNHKQKSQAENPQDQKEAIMKKRLLALLLICSMTAVMITGCATYTKDGTEEAASSAEASSAPADTGETSAETTKNAVTTLNVSAGTAVTLNEFTSQASNDYDSLYLLMSSLFRYYDGTVENDACETYELSEDKLTYTFHLRQGLTYSNGTVITAKDFAYALQKFISPDSGSAFASYYLGIKGAADFNAGNADWDAVGVTCPDDSTLVINLAEEDSSFLNLLAIYPFYPITEEFATAKGDTLGTSPDTILCSGPYTVSEWTVDTSMTFVKNKNWWNSDNEFPMETINLMDIESANTEVSMFQNGELDVISSVDSNYVSTISDNVKSYESSTEMFLWMKEAGTSEEATKCLDNDNFRKALTYALDREAIGAAVNTGFIGTNRAVSSNYPGTNGKYIDEYPIDTCPIQGDTALAVDYLNKALKELGYSDVSELPQMNYITFERDDMKLLGETIIDTWKQVLGITTINFAQYPISTAIQQFYTGDYDLFMISLGCSIRPTEVIECFTPDGDYGFFTQNWATDITEQLADANAKEFQSDDYFKGVAAAEQSLLNEYSLVPLYNQTMYYALADGVEGFVEPGTVFQFQFNHLSYTK